MASDLSKLKIFTGNANRPLAEAVVRHLGVPMGNALVGRFSDNEVRVEYIDNVRNTHVVIVQPMDPRDGNFYMELRLLANTARGSSAGHVTGVIPYYGYARQDRKDKPRVPISAELIAGELQLCGFQSLMLFDLHAAQIQGFFDPTRCVVDHLYARPVMVEAIKNLLGLVEGQAAPQIVLVAPDAGATKMVQSYADKLHCDMVFFQKRRPEPNKVHVSRLVGDVDGKVAVMIDDTIDTATTLTKAAEVLEREGATRIIAVAVHPILSGQANSLIDQSPIETVLVSDTLCLADRAKSPKIHVVTMAPLLAEAIRRNHEGESVSSLIS